jgi:hypothetical protein
VKPENLSSYRSLWVAALATLLQACGGAKSSSTSGPGGGPVPTQRIHIDLQVESRDPRMAVVRVNLSDGHTLGVSYRLDGGDFLRACVGGVCRNLADNDSVYTPDYIARFDYQPGVDFVVSFHRQQAENAPDSRAALPPAFDIVTPADRQQVTDSETVVVSWTPTGAPVPVSLTYEAECTFVSGPSGFSVGSLGTDPDGDGSESVAIDPIVQLVRATSTSTLTGCHIDLVVRHELRGRVDPAFDQGTAVGIVSREVRLVYVPR